MKTKAQNEAAQKIFAVALVTFLAGFIVGYGFRMAQEPETPAIASQVEDLFEVAAKESGAIVNGVKVVLGKNGWVRIKKAEKQGRHISEASPLNASPLAIAGAGDEGYRQTFTPQSAPEVRR